jgi:hypothetical protein
MTWLPSKSLPTFRPRVSLFGDGHRPPLKRYAASRSAVFGLSSPGLRRKRFSTLPKPWKTYKKLPGLINSEAE